MFELVVHKVVGRQGGLLWIKDRIQYEYRYKFTLQRDKTTRFERIRKSIVDAEFDGL